jgi:hypothetical protein
MCVAKNKMDLNFYYINIICGQKREVMIHSKSEELIFSISTMTLYKYYCNYQRLLVTLSMMETTIFLPFHTLLTEEIEFLK